MKRAKLRILKIHIAKETASQSASVHCSQQPGGHERLFFRVKRRQEASNTGRQKMYPLSFKECHLVT